MTLRRPLGWLFALLATYLALSAAMYAFQHHLQFRPDPAPMGPAAARQPGAEAQTLRTSDGERIVVWWRPPADAAAPVYLYLPGNGANLLARGGRLRRLAADGAGFLAVSWRGYGGSSGRPSEPGLLADARAAYAALAQRVDPARIVVFGESLGTTVAVLLAAEVDVAALVLDSSFSSVQDVAASRYWWLPVPWLITDPFRADLAAPRVRAPVLQVHCLHDPVTPIHFAHRLNALLPGRLPVQIVEDRCHAPRFDRFEPLVRDFVDRVLPQPRGRTTSAATAVPNGDRGTSRQPGRACAAVRAAGCRRPPDDDGPRGPACRRCTAEGARAVKPAAWHRGRPLRSSDRPRWSALCARRPQRHDAVVHHSDLGSTAASARWSVRPRPASSRRSVHAATATTMRWPRRSTA